MSNLEPFPKKLFRVLNEAEQFGSKLGIGWCSTDSSFNIYRVKNIKQHVSSNSCREIVLLGPSRQPQNPIVGELAGDPRQARTLQHLRAVCYGGYLGLLHDARVRLSWTSTASSI